jgi:hypothetical protein
MIDVVSDVATMVGPPWSARVPAAGACHGRATVEAGWRERPKRRPTDDADPT